MTTSQTQAIPFVDKTTSQTTPPPALVVLAPAAPLPSCAPTLKVLVPHMSCLIYQQLSDTETDPLSYAIEQGYAEIYIMTPSGIFKHHKLRGNGRYVRVKVDAVPGVTLSPLKEEVAFLPAGKIPYDLLHQVESFFKKVIQVKGTAVEAMIWVLYNEAQGYHLFVPNQTVSKASARYDWSGVPSGSSIIVDIHSHADFNAFFSGTDNADDAGSIRFSGVIGHNDKPVRSYAWRFNYKDKKFDIKVDDVFEVPQAEVLATPEEWLTKVNTSSPAAYTPTVYQGTGKGKWHSGFASADRGDADWWRNNTSATSGKGYSKASREDMGQEDPGERLETYMEEYNRKRGVSEAKDEVVTSGKKGSGKKGSAASKKAIGSLALSAAGEPDDYAVKTTRHEFWETADFWGMETGGREARSNAEIAKVMGMTGLLEDEPGHPSFDKGGELSEVEQMSDFVVCAVTSAQTNPRFDEIACNKGLEAATGFCVISDLMASVDGNDDLVEELVTDMAMMMNGDKRGAIIRSLYSSLPESERERFATNGF